MQHLTKQEQNEPMFKTWGRLRTAIEYRKDWQRIDALVDKFQKDLDHAKIEENHFEEEEYDEGMSLGDYIDIYNDAREAEATGN